MRTNRNSRGKVTRKKLYKNYYYTERNCNRCKSKGNKDYCYAK